MRATTSTPRRDRRSRIGRTPRVRIAALVAASLAGLLPVLAPAAPAGADTATLTSLGTIDHTLSGAYISTGTTEAYSSPALADITGDSIPELVVGNLDGTVQAYRVSDRHGLWSYNAGRTAIEASPAIADMNGDGKPDVIIGTMDGRVIVLSGPTGSVLRTFRQGAPQFCPPGQDCRPDGFFATPAIGDVNGDGIADIVAASWDHSVYAWSRGGTLLWRRFLEDTLWSSPVIADIDRNGSNEVILGGDIYANNPLGKPEGGLVWILNRNGSTYGGYPKSVPGQTVWSSPAVGDINGDGFLDVVVGSGTNFRDPAGRKVQGFTAKTGGNLPGWPVTVEGRVMSSPAIGDLDGDDGLEVAVASEGGYVYAFDGTGARRWRVCNAIVVASCKTGYSTHGSVVIADVDADGRQEVVSSLDKDTRIFDPRSGALEATYRLTGGRTLPPVSSPAIGQVDGRTIIAQASIYRSGTHGGGVAPGDLTRVNVLTTNKELCRADWPQFHRDGRRTGKFQAAHNAWIPFRCPSDFVAQQYLDFLGRRLDSAGSISWTQKLQAGQSGSFVIRQFLGSSEFGAVVAPVVRAYFGVFGTYPTDVTDVRAKAAQLRNTAAANRPAVLARIAGEYADDAAIKALSNSDFVKKAFGNVYHRAPTAAELNKDTARLDGGLARGNLVTEYSESSIGVTRQAAEVNVTMVYLAMLGRKPDAGGFAYWVPKVKATNTDALITGFQRSNEYLNRVT